MLKQEANTSKKDYSIAMFRGSSNIPEQLHCLSGLQVIIPVSSNPTSKQESSYETSNTCSQPH
jgi:hypothetical protein